LWYTWKAVEEEEAEEKAFREGYTYGICTIVALLFLYLLLY